MNTPQTITPGPWESEHKPGGYRRKPTIVIRSKGSTPRWKRVARVDNEADAVAFLAVPELLEALEAISAAWPAHGSNVQNETADAMAARARAALAKAGRS